MSNVKALIVAVVSKLPPGNKIPFHPVDERGNSLDVVIKESASFLSEEDFLKDEKFEVSKVVFQSSTLSFTLRDPPPDYASLEAQLKEKAKEFFGDTRSFVLPSSGVFVSNGVIHDHREGISNYELFLYLNLYKTLIEEVPDLVVLDVSLASSIESLASSRATELAVYDFASTTKKEVEVMQVASPPCFAENEEVKLYATKREVVRKVDLAGFFTQEIKLVKQAGEKGINATGKSDIYGVGKAIQYGLPLALLYLVREAKLENFVKEEDLERKIKESIKVNKSEKLYLVEAGLEAHENSIYYYMGYHFIQNYRKLAEGEEFDVDRILEVSELMGEGRRVVINAELERIKELASLLEKETEVSLDYLLKLGEMKVSDWLRKREVEEETECEFDKVRMVSHAGFERRSTVVKVKERKILLKYRKECVEEIINGIKNLDKEES